MLTRFHALRRADLWRAVLLIFVCCGPAQICHANGARRVFGPILTWDGDPATTMNITWVEGSEISGKGQSTASPMWRTGKAGFGYGDEDDNTVLVDMKDKYARVYLRKEFELDEITDAEVALRIRYDDGFIAYLNGKEIARAGVRRGRGKGARGITNHEAQEEFSTFKINKWLQLARSGRNLLAVEGHNEKRSSSDFTLDPYVTIQGDRETTAVIEKHASWDYLAGRDPGPSWNRRKFRPYQSRLARRSSENDGAVELLTDVVYFRRVGTSDWNKAAGEHRSFGDTNDIVRKVFIDGLEPQTDYEFAVGAKPGSYAKLPRFRTAPDILQAPFRFVTGGDMGTSSTAKAMNRLAGKLDPVFAMIGGDLAYANGKDLKAWHDWLDDWRKYAVTKDGRSVPLVIGIGNHEMGSELDKNRAKELGVHHDAQFFFSLFTLPQGRTNYTLNFGNFLSLIMLDSDHATPIAGEQTAWLAHTLAEIADRQFRIVCYHRPAYGTAKEPNQEVRAHWVPLFEKYQPTVVFENDHHTLKRTYRIRNGKVDPSGVLYLGDGAWGVDTRDVPKPGERWYLANAASVNHLWLVTLDKEKARFQALDKKGKELDRIALPD